MEMHKSHPAQKLHWLGWTLLVILAILGYWAYGTGSLLLVVAAFACGWLGTIAMQTLDDTWRSRSFQPHDPVAPVPEPDLPDRLSRESILKSQAGSMHLATDVALNALAIATSGLNQGDLERLCREAARIANAQGHEVVEMSDFESALDQELLDASDSFLMDEHQRRRAAYHMAAHALIQWVTPASRPLQVVSILTNVCSGADLPDFDRNTYSRNALVNWLRLGLAGRAGEEIALSETSTWSESDLRQATSLARRMVIHWGMGSLGPMTLHADGLVRGDSPSWRLACSEATASQVDQEVKKLLETEYQSVRNRLFDLRPSLDRLALALITDETLETGSLYRLLGPRPVSEADEIETIA